MNDNNETLKLGSQIYEFVIADRGDEGKMSLPYAEKYGSSEEIVGGIGFGQLAK